MKHQIDSETQQSVDKIPGAAINPVCPAFLLKASMQPEAVCGQSRECVRMAQTDVQLHLYDSDLLQKTTTRSAPLTGAFGIRTKSNQKFI